MWCLYNQPICACICGKSYKSSFIRTRSPIIQMFTSLKCTLIACMLLVVSLRSVFIAFAGGITVEIAQLRYL